MLDDGQVQRILFANAPAEGVIANLERVRRDELALDRAFQNEPTVTALQRLLIFLGYSTASTGAYIVDGDFGRGTNRGVLQFQHELGLPHPGTREQLCYECTYRDARKNIVAIPDSIVDSRTLDAMINAALEKIKAGDITFGDFEEALFHLNRVHDRKNLTCMDIVERYGAATGGAIRTIREEKNLDVRREWILAIIKQETSGVVRPRFEQHILTRRNAKSPDLDFSELRLRSTSFGLGQVMGFNYSKVGSPSAAAMLRSPVDEQVLFVGRFIASKPAIVSKADPTSSDFHTLARYYNGPGYASHHYHERLQKWFNEFRTIATG